MRQLLRDNWFLAAIMPVALVLAMYTGAFGEVNGFKPSSYTYSTAAPGKFSIGTTNVDESDIIPLHEYKNFSYQVKCVSASDDVKYDLQFYTAIQNDKNAMIEIASGALVDDSTAETWTAPTSIKPPVAGFGYFKLTGVSGNTHDTLCELRMGQEK
jgi:hypothetical protein